jgi:hypothetical protein
MMSRLRARHRLPGAFMSVRPAACAALASLLLLSLSACGDIRKKAEPGGDDGGDDDGGDGGSGTDAAPVTSCDGPEDCDEAAPICADEGICVGCQTVDDCADTGLGVCDPETRQCRACTDHGECASAVCDIDTGACAADTEVLRVAPDGQAAPCGTAVRPCALIDEALVQVDLERRFIHLAPGTYNQIVSLPEFAVTIVGPEAIIDATGFEVDSAVAVSAESAITIDGVTVVHPAATFDGGAIRCDNSTLTLRRVIARESGSYGLAASDCALTVQDSRFLANQQLGLSLSRGELTLERSWIDGNGEGGMITSSAGVIRNNLFTSNGAINQYNGAIRGEFTKAGTPLLIAYNTFAGNACEGFETTIISCVAGTTLSSNIIVDSTVNAGGGIVRCPGGVVSSNLTDVAIDEPGYILGEPLFVSPVRGDYHVDAKSPAVDGGDPDFATATDQSGAPRPLGRGPDIGALESY